MENNKRNFLARLQDDPITRIAQDASLTENCRSLLIPIAWGIVIVSTGYLFSAGSANGISLHIIDILSSISCFAIFFFARLLAKHKFISGFYLWIVAGLAAALFPPLLLWFRNGYIEKSFLQTVPVGVVTYPILTILIGVIVSNRLNLRKESKLVRSQNAELLRKAEMLDEDAATVESELRTEIQSRLESALATESFSASNVDTAQTSITKLREVINLVIRPIAHEIDQLDANESIARTRFKNSHGLTSAKAVKNNLEFIPIGSLISIPFFTMSILVFDAPAMFFVYGYPGLISGLLTLSLEILMLNFIKSKLSEVKVAGSVAVLFISMTITIVGLMYRPLVHLLNSNIHASNAIPFGYTLSGASLAIYLLLIARKQASIAALEHINTKNERLVALLRQKVWVKQRQLARIVHGQVQSRFIASALRLSSAKVIDQELLESVWSEVRAAVNSLTETSDNEVALVEMLKNIAEAWDGVCGIEYSIDSELIEIIDHQPYARTCIQELITEAVSNGAKHIQAIKAYISITQPNDKTLEISVRCAGDTSQVHSVKPGYGSKTLDDITTQWKLEITDTGSTLTAEVPIR